MDHPHTGAGVQSKGEAGAVERSSRCTEQSIKGHRLPASMLSVLVEKLAQANGLDEPVRLVLHLM